MHAMQKVVPSMPTHTTQYSKLNSNTGVTNYEATVC